MEQESISRRTFLQGVAGVTTLAKTESKPMGVKWQIGCFNRPWGAWGYDVALEKMHEAGFRTTGILGDHKGEPFLDPDATPEYLESLKARIEKAHLKPIMGRLHIRHDTPLDEAIALTHKQIEHAHQLKLKSVMALGTSNPTE